MKVAFLKISAIIYAGENFYFAWLRTGNNGYAYVAHYLSGSGNFGIAFPVCLLAVRPALQFNTCQSLVISSLPRNLFNK